ncbi:ABC-type transport system, involved in lipoprotein release, permease component [Fodinibius salinus]|uniref:ABC-type transport system, involved in lipoprotein release, permease component n=1 Tax=Fodinibius salinus TaxID=860790 RepID=A0A5D3YF00_9BACT|nr:FtsX-like permease family protein [Fodinibius salinus]TYP91986.1 ABC-type transport system, involved in lipoprotein release, permease component [Fodinibius salinus]
MFSTIIKLGWKNIWRNPTRSAVVIIAVLLGTWSGIFLSGFFTGMMQGYLDNQFELTVGHIEISHPQFDDMYSPEYYVPNSDQVIRELDQLSYIQDISTQSLATGLAQSARNNYGATIHGLHPDSNYSIKEYLKKGSMPGASQKRNPIIIGQKLAERLDIKLDSRIVLSFQDKNGEITGGAFRVAGIFDTFSNPYDESNVFVNRNDLNGLMELSNQVHNIRLTLSDFSQAQHYTQQLQDQFPNLQIKTWGETAPELQYMYDMTDLMMYIVMVIIIIALIFSIINTMLMAVLERTRELGMLRAVGMNKPRVFSMIVSETVFLTMVGAPIGMLLSWITISYFGDVGIDLSIFAEGLSAYGFGTVIYPYLPNMYYLNITLMIAGAALLSALYPAFKSLQLNPVKAIRKFN